MTRAKIDQLFAELCGLIGKRVAKDSKDKGAWALNYYALAGGYQIIEHAKGGGESTPFGEGRYKATEFATMLRFAGDCVRKSKGGQ